MHVRWRKAVRCANRSKSLPQNGKTGDKRRRKEGERGESLSEEAER